jgi:phage protein D
LGIISFINQGSLPESAAATHPQGAPLLRDFYAPNFELLIRGGKGAQPFAVTEEIKQCIAEVIYEDNSDQLDRLTLRLENQVDSRGERAVLSILDSKLFAEGHIVELQMGYGNNLHSIGAGVVVKATPEFPEDGYPTVTVEAYDPLYLASRNRPVGGVSYKGTRDSQVAEIIGMRNAFDVQSTDSTGLASIERTELVVDRVQNKGDSDYEFLKKIADSNGFNIFSKWDAERKLFVLYFRSPALSAQKEVMTFVYNDGEVPYVSSLVSFSPTMNAYDVATDYEVFFLKDKKVGGSRIRFSKQLDAQTQAELKELNERRFGAKTFSSKPSDGDGVQVAFKAFGASYQFPPYKRFATEAQAQAAIEEFIKRQKENFVTARGVIVGNEIIQSSQVHNLQGVGQLSGKYYFTQVIHRMSRDGPYRTEFACRKVIDDVVVQSPPAFGLSELDERFARFKGLMSKKTTETVTAEEDF